MNSKLVTWVAIAALGGAAVGSAGVYAVQNKRATELEARVNRLDAERQSLETSLEAAESSLAVKPVTPPAQDATAPEVLPPADVVRTKEFAFIKDVTGYPPATPRQRGGSRLSGRLVADYAQFLTGPKAADAAKAAGDESPPPNDYYIVNSNPKLRTLSVAQNVTVRLTTNPDGTADPAGYKADFSTWANFFEAPSDENAPVRASGYWLTLEDGIVVAIQEQFVP